MLLKDELLRQRFCVKQIGLKTLRVWRETDDRGGEYEIVKIELCKIKRLLLECFYILPLYMRLIQVSDSTIAEMYFKTQ